MHVLMTSLHACQPGIPALAGLELVPIYLGLIDEAGR